MESDSAEDSEYPSSQSNDAEIEAEWTRLKSELLNCVKDGTVRKLSHVPMEFSADLSKAIDLESPISDRLPAEEPPVYRYVQAGVVASDPVSINCVSFLHEASNTPLFTSSDHDFLLCFRSTILLCGLSDPNSEFGFKPKAGFCEDSKTEKLMVARFLVEEGKIRVAAGGKDGILKIFTIFPDFEAGFGLMGHRNAIRDLRAVGCSGFVVTCSDDLTVRLWNYGSQVQVAIFQGIVAHSDGVKCLDIHHSNTLIATGSQDRCIQLWRLDDRLQALMQSSHSFSPNFTLSHGVRIAQNRFKTQLVTQPLFLTYRVHSAGICALRFYHDLIVSQDTSNHICVWQPNLARSLGSFILLHSIHTPTEKTAKFGLHCGLGLISVSSTRGQMVLYSLLDLQNRPIHITGGTKTNFRIKGSCFNSDGSNLLVFCKSSHILKFSR